MNCKPCIIIQFIFCHIFTHLFTGNPLNYWQLLSGWTQHAPLRDRLIKHDHASWVSPTPFSTSTSARSFSARSSCIRLKLSSTTNFQALNGLYRMYHRVWTSNTQSSSTPSGQSYNMAVLKDGPWPRHPRRCGCDVVFGKIRKWYDFCYSDYYWNNLTIWLVLKF